MTGETIRSEFTAVTRAVIYKISKSALAPLLMARPEMAIEFSSGLVNRDAEKGGVPEGGVSREIEEASWIVLLKA